MLKPGLPAMSNSAVERWELEIEQRSLAVFAGEDQRGFFVCFKLRMAVGVAAGFGERLTFVIQQRDGDAGLRRTVFRLWVKRSSRL